MPQPLSPVDGAILDLRGTEGTNGPPPTEIWEDTNGNGNYAELNDFAYTPEDGWTGEGLKCDGIDSYLQTVDLGEMNNLTVELTMYSPEKTDKTEQAVLWTDHDDTIISIRRWKLLY